MNLLSIPVLLPPTRSPDVQQPSGLGRAEKCAERMLVSAHTEPLSAQFTFPVRDPSVFFRSQAKIS
jgi:hypothetical protein